LARWQNEIRFYNDNMGIVGSMDVYITGTDPANLNQPTYLRLSRKDDMITGYVSIDGFNWQTIGTVTPQNIGSSSQVGLISIGISSVGTNLFDDFKFSGGIMPDLIDQDSAVCVSYYGNSTGSCIKSSIVPKKQQELNIKVSEKTLEVYGINGNKGSFIVYSINGVDIINVPLNALSGDNERKIYNIDSKLASGVYFAEVKIINKVSKKIIFFLP
jgi:hypothetical protein